MPIFHNNQSCLNCQHKSEIFSCLTQGELGLIDQNRFEVSFKAGEIMFKQGTPSPHYLCMTSGLAKIYIEGYGKNLLLGIVKPHDYIVGPGIYVDNRHYFSAAALTDSTACLVDVNSYKKLIRENPEFAEEFMTRVSKQAILNFEQIISLTQKQMPGRIADALLYLSNEVYHSASFVTNISRQDLADLTAMTKESAIRILKDLKDNKYINAEGSRFEILNMDALRHLSRIG
jgi:CRP/FNR family transcriptional regulator